MLRAGTEATPLIMAFADAVEIAYATLTDTQQRYIQLKTEFLNWAAAFPEIMMISTENGLPNTISLAVQGINGDTMVRNMDLNGIAISTGSACSTGAVDPSHVISALGHPEWVTTGAFRVSMGASTTSEIIQNFQGILIKIIRNRIPTP
jgi:cysteine desulfurase